MRSIRRVLPSALACATLLGAAGLPNLSGCGSADPAAAQANLEEQKLLQQKIQIGVTKAPATKAARRR